MYPTSNVESVHRMEGGKDTVMTIWNGALDMHKAPH
jgi:hypothetical protein